MKSLLKWRGLILLATIFAFSIFSCEKDIELVGLETSYESTKHSESNKYKTNLVNAETISNLKNELNDISKKTSFKNSPSQKDNEAFWINYENIVELVDSIGNVTYAVQLKSNQPSDKVFYNIIITERVDGTNSNPFVVKYEHTNGITRNDYRNSLNKRFRGKMSSYSLESFNNSIINSRGTTSDPCWDEDIDIPDKDPEAIGDSSSSSGSGGSSGGSGSTGGFGSTGSSSTGSSSTGSTGSTGTGGDSDNTKESPTGTVEVGEGCFCDPEQPQQKVRVDLTGKDSDCPEDDIAAPINDIPEDQELLFPDCASFEFANLLNSSVKGAHVTGINNSFFAVEQINPSTTQFNSINILYPNLYFTMPVGWTNGRSATLAAQALQNSISATESWYRANPTATEAQVESVWWTNMKLAMGRVGGSVSKSALFTVRSPSPYLKRFFSTGNCG
ncbi:hypothetical protein [Flagellimonas marinaquae]